jgi:hypothetical protein
MINKSVPRNGTCPGLSILSGQVECGVGVQVLLVDVDLFGPEQFGGHFVEAVLGRQVEGRVLVVVALRPMLLF